MNKSATSKFSFKTSSDEVLVCTDERGKACDGGPEQLDDLCCEQKIFIGETFTQKCQAILFSMTNKRKNNYSLHYFEAFRFSISTAMLIKITYSIAVLSFTLSFTTFGIGGFHYKKMFEQFISFMIRF